MKNLLLQSTLWCESFYPQRKVSVTSADLAIEKNELQGRSKSARSLLTPHHSSEVSVSSQTSARVAQEWLKSAAVILLLFTLGVGQMWADAAEVYKETFGSTSSNTAYGSYTGFSATTSMFSTSGTVQSHYSGSGSVGKNNLSSTNLSSGYTGASGLSGCYHTGTANTQATIIQVSNIDISGYSNLHLSFGALGGSTTHTVIVTYKIDNGSETTLISSGSITNAKWTLVEEDIPSTGSSLTIWIKHKPTKGWTIRLDDIMVTGCPAPKTLTNGTITSSTAHLSWADADDTGSYEVYRSTDSSTPGASQTPTTTVSTKYVDLEDLSASSTYYWWVRSKCSSTNKSAWVAGTSFNTPAGASCTDNPSVGAASLNGSFNLSSVGVSCASSGAGTNCSITEYGWVWSDGANNTNPLIDGSNVTNSPKTSGAPSGSGGSFTGTLSGSFTVDHTYYYKAYVTNGKPATTYSSVQTFTPRSITFNSNGGSSVSTIYLNSGTAASAPTAPTKSGSVFAGWYSNEGLTSAVDWSANITSSKTYYAKWYTVTVNVKDEAGNTLSGSGKPTASCTGTTLSTAAGSEKYVFKEWQVSNTAELGSSKETASNSLTNITGNVTVTAVYHAPISLTKGTNTGASTFNFSSNPIGYGETLTITCAADAGYKGNPTVTADGTHGTISVVSATSVTIANVQSAMTVNISYTAKSAATVKLHVAGSTSTITGKYEDDSYTLPSDAAECPDMGLYGWYTEAYEHATTAPSGAKFKSKGATVELAAGDNDFYAVYATIDAHSSAYFEEITSESALTSGDYLIGGLTSPYCMKTTKGSTYMNELGMSSYNTDGVINYNSNEDIIWVITRDGSNVTIKGNDNSKYLAINSGVIGTQDGSYSFTFDYGITKADSWTFKSVTESTQQLIYSGYSGFCAGTAQSNDISLYKRRVVSSGPYTTSPSCQTYTLATAVTPSATGTAEAGKTVLAEGKTTTVTATPIDNYSFAYWTISGGGSTMSNTSDGKSTDNPVTVTMGNANTTITAHFTENAYHYATFMNNGEPVDGYEDVKTYDGTRPTPPTLTSSNACDPTECNQFYGWVAESDIWDETTEDISGVTIYRSAGSLPVVSGSDVVYHAVWAKGSGVANIPSPLIAKWDKQALSDGVAVTGKDAAGDDVTGVTMTISNLSLNGNGIYTYCKAAEIGAYPLITISGLNFSAYDGGVLTFFARASAQDGAISIEYSTNYGESYTEMTDWTGGGTTTKEYSYIVDLPKTTTDVQIKYNKNTGNFYFGTVRVYGEKESNEYTYEELTSSNTSGWSGADWDGYYLIVGESNTMALRSDVMEGMYGLTEVSPSAGAITTYDLGMVFNVTYNSSTSKYVIQSVATQDYLTNTAGGVSSNAFYLLGTSATDALGMAYNDITHATDKYIRWNSSNTPHRFGSYSSSTGAQPTLYKILTSFTKWRVICCEKKNVNLYSSGTVEGGTFEADKTSACAGATITLSVTSTNTGYNFNSWTVTGATSGTIEVTNGQFTMPDEAVTVTAVFATAHTTTVTLDKQEGTGGTNSVTATVNLPMPAADMPTRSGYEFGGYYAAPNGNGTQYYAADGSSAHVWDNSEDDTETLYAKWTSNGYTVTLNKEGATTQGTASVSVTYGTNTNLTSPIDCPTYTNKVFGGYWTTASGEGTQLIDGDGNWIPSVTGYTGVNKQWLYANNIELHARWTNVSYTNYRTTCGPEITVTGGPVYLTSYAGCEVLTTGNITVSSENWQSTVEAPKYLRFKLKDIVSGTTYAFTGGTSIASSEFRIYNSSGNGGSYADQGYIAIPTGTTSASYDFRIAYTPSAGEYNTRDHYVLEVEVMDNSATKKTLTMETEDLYGRTLPEQFVIAAKKGGVWYALPNDLAGTEAATKAAKAVEIIVDNTTTPTTAIYAPENTLYKATGYYTGPNVSDRNRSGVRFTRNGSQYLQVSTVEGTNLMWLSTTGGTDVQDWYLNSSDFNVYSVKIDPRGGTSGYRNKVMGILGSHFGFYNSAILTSGASDIYLLPVETVLAEATVVEWGAHKAIVEADAGSTGLNATQVIARIGNEASKPLPISQTLSGNNGATKYNWTINVGNTFDFTTQKDEKLYLDWLNSSGTVVGTSMIPIPWLIDGEKTMATIDGTAAHWEKAEVHVLNGATLTANGGSFAGSSVTIGHLEIYPGATVKVTTGTVNTTNLVLRYGWTRVDGKTYDYARMYIVSTANLTHSSGNAYADWYIDYDRYYSMAVPWPVSTGKITYKNSNNAASAGVKILWYDGEQRATTGQTMIGKNWKEYTWGNEGTMPSTLDPSKGYALTAKRPTGKAFSVVRMPLTFTNAWTTLGEQGEVNSEHKNQVSVTGWGKGSAEWYAMGWNFIANPYMATFNGDDEGIYGHLQDQEGKGIRYVTKPDLDFQSYDQVPIEEADLEPARGFFIQANNASAQTITFVKGNIEPPSAAPARFMTVDEALPEQEAYIRLSYEGGKDQMGLIIGDDYTADYEVNADLAKVLGEGNFLKTYMNYGGMDMAYVAINSTLAKEWIPVTVKIPATGEYTFSLTNSSSVEELEGVFLIDYANGSVITNLIGNDYVFTAEEGTITDRFAINATYGGRETPTLIDAVQSGAIDSDKPIKFLFHEKVYILYQGIIYDAVGKKVSEINK